MAGSASPVYAVRIERTTHAHEDYPSERWHTWAVILSCDGEDISWCVRHDSDGAESSAALIARAFGKATGQRVEVTRSHAPGVRILRDPF